MRGFLDFVRGQGVVGLAVGFILGGAIAKLVTALVTDFINPLIGIVLGGLNLKSFYTTVGGAKLMWGDLLSVLVDFFIVAMVVYFGVKWLKLDSIDRKKT